MLPSRLFKNVGVPPALRSPLLLHPRLSSAVRIRLLCYLRLNTPPPGAVRRLSMTAPRLLRASPLRASTSNIAESGAGAKQTATLAPNGQAVKEEPPEPRLQLTFTCAVEGCADRSTHTFTRRAYERGIVIVQCPNCKNRYVRITFTPHSCF